MNHRTPAEDFRTRLAALSREQLEEAMHYLRGYDSLAMDAALQLVSAPAGPEPDDEPVPYVPAPHLHAFDGGDCTVCGLSLADWAGQIADDAEFGHIAMEGTL